MVPAIIRRLLVFALALYALPLIVLYGFQRQLVFNASHALKGPDLSQGAKLMTLGTANDDRIAAYFGHALQADGRPDPDYARRPTLLFFYGKAGSLNDSQGLFQHFRQLDANVLMPDYVGFGLSSGQASERNCYATATASYNFLRSQRDIDQKRLFIAGYSLGSGVAVDLAARETTAGQPVAGLALFAAYTSMAEEAHQEYPIYPTPLLRRLLKYPFSSQQKMPQVKCPVLIVHSRADRLIPYTMSDRLAAASGGPVTRLPLSNAAHGTYFLSDGPTLYPALRHFLEHT